MQLWDVTHISNKISLLEILIEIPILLITWLTKGENDLNCLYIKHLLDNELI